VSPPIRAGAIVFGGALLLVALWLRWVGAPAGPVAVMTFLGLALTIGTIVESRYKSPRAGVPGAGWVETGERFVDPETGKLVTVYNCPRTGERQYRTDPNAH